MLLGTIYLYHFILFPWPCLGVSRSVQSKVCWLCLDHFSYDLDEICCDNQFKLNILRPLLSKIYGNSGNNCCFTDNMKKLQKLWCPFFFFFLFKYQFGWISVCCYNLLGCWSSLNFILHNVQGRELCWHDFMKYMFNIICQDTYEPIFFFKLGMMLDTAKLYSLIPVRMTLMFTQGHRVAGKGRIWAVTLL